ncbi:DUF3549 family protein [Pseudoteredinibacter isoporae]|uniref:DUF3549 family protein n=1 Tax=Pseudoteredinibacter isoporae TaxID=570281 RepID=UPI003103103D
MSAPVSTLYQLLESMKVHCRWFDAGHRISKLSPGQWQQFEDGQTAYPQPYLKHAYIGLAFWPADDQRKQQVQLWCLRFPLDEQGKLDLASRDQFLKHLLTALSSNLEAAKKDEQLTAVLEGNPYVFKPSDEKQANLHAVVSQQLKQPHSAFMSTVLNYFAKPEGDDWQQLGIQGLADLACRWQDHQNEICAAIPQLPSPVLCSFCHCLEHHAINGIVADALLEKLKNSEDKAEQIALLRGISYCQDNARIEAALNLALSSPVMMDVEMLVSLSSRCSQQLVSEKYALVFLEHLAAAGHDVFAAVMQELLFQATLREPLLGYIRSPERSETLSQAIGHLFSQPKPQAKPDSPAEPTH